MRRHLPRIAASIIPTLILGLYLGRVSSELLSANVPLASDGLRVLGAIILTGLWSFLCIRLLRSLTLPMGWPFHILLVYVLSTRPDVKVAWLTAAIVAIILVQIYFQPDPPGRVRLSATTEGILTTIPFALLYLLTVAPGILPADSGELQLVATDLGVAHPPGFPLYTMLAHLATRLPLAISPAMKVNLFSVVTSSLTLLLVYISTVTLTGRRLGGIVATVALGSSTTFWSQATTANIRSMTGLSAAAAICVLIQMHVSSDRSSGESSHAIISHKKTHKDLTLFALALGFGIVHHASLVFMGVVFTAYFLIIEPGFIRDPTRWRRPLMALLLSLLPLLYLPWRGLASVTDVTIRGASPSLATWDGFLSHVLALGFRGDFFYFRNPADLWRRFMVMGNVMTFQFEPILLVGMAFGLALMLRRDRRLALLLFGSFVVHTAVTATYRAPQTVEYMLPAYIPAAIVLGYSVGFGQQHFTRDTFSLPSATSYTFTAIMLAGAAYQTADRYYSYRRLHLGDSTRAYVEPLLNQAPEQATILADWHWAAPLWYLQEVGGRRPDLEIRYVFPTAEPYAETWARRIREELESRHSVVATHYEQNAYGDLPVPEPIGDAFLFASFPRVEIPEGFSATPLRLGGAIDIMALSLDSESVEIGRETILTVAWQPVGNELPPATALFAHLVGPDGNIYAQDDPLARPRSEGVTLTQLRLTPRLGAMPGLYDIMIGAYSAEPLPDENGNARTPVVSLRVLPMSHPPVTMNPTGLQMLGERSALHLIGYDWDNTLPGPGRLYLHWLSDEGFYTEVRNNITDGVALSRYLGPWGIPVGPKILIRDRRAYYVSFGQGIVWHGPLLDPGGPLRAGEQVFFRQTFDSSIPVERDLATSVRLIGYEEDGYLWDWWDLDEAFGVPAMGAIPTLKWISGSTIHDPHRLEVSSEAYPGQVVGMTLAMHDTFTNRALPILDERFTRETAWQLLTISP